MEKYFSDPSWAQANLAAIALLVSLFSLVVAGLALMLQWLQRYDQKREMEVPGFEGHISNTKIPDWYELKIVARNFGATQVIIEEIIALKPRRCRLVSECALETLVNGRNIPRNPEVSDGKRKIGLHLSLAPSGSAGQIVRDVAGTWPGTSDHASMTVFVNCSPSWFGRKIRSISLRMMCRRKDRRDSLISEIIRVNMPI